MGFAARSSRRAVVGACAIATGIAIAAAIAHADLISSNGTAAISPAMTLATGASCSGSRTAIAAGFDSDGLSTVWLGPLVPTVPWPFTTLLGADPGSYPAQQAFFWTATSDAQVEHLVTSAAICAPFAATTVVGDVLFIPTSGAGSGRVLCPEGSFATGGGIDFPEDSATVTVADGPVLDDGSTNGVRLVSVPDGAAAAPIGWRGAGRFLQGSVLQSTARVAVVCAPTPLTTQVASVTVPAYTQAATRALCPAGTVAYGGGVDDDDPDSALLTATAPVFDDGTPNGQRLISRPNGADAAPIGWFGSIRNDDALDHTLKVAAICPEPIPEQLELAVVSALLATRRGRRRRS